MNSSSGQSSGYDLSFKILLIGDSAVGKSSLLVSFISNSAEDIAPTIGISLLLPKNCSFSLMLVTKNVFWTKPWKEYYFFKIKKNEKLWSSHVDFNCAVVDHLWTFCGDVEFYVLYMFLFGLLWLDQCFHGHAALIRYLLWYDMMWCYLFLAYVGLCYVGVDFKIKMLTVGGKRLKLTIWDTGNSCSNL